MVISATLRKLILRVLQDAPSPLTFSAIYAEVKRSSPYDYSQDEVYDTLCDLTAENELLEDTAWSFRR